MVDETRTLLTIGKSPVSSYNNQAKIWVVDMTAKQQATLDLSKELVRSGILEEIQLFSTYSYVPVKVKSNNRLRAGDKNAIIRFSNPKPSAFNSSEIFQKLKIPIVKMSELDGSRKYSRKNSKGTYLAYDIRCIQKCIITKSFECPQEVDGWKYQLGSITITNHTTDGYTTSEGLVIPSKLFCWVHPDFVYPVHTLGDAYGVLKMNKETEIRFDLCFFDVIRMGEELEEDKQDKSKTSTVKNTTNKERSSTNSRRKKKRPQRTYNLEPLFKKEL